MTDHWSRTLIPTARQVPADAEVPSHQLMLRGGMIHRLGSGVYSYLPLGWRSLRKVIQIIRDQMDRAGAVEVFLPTLQPIELWEKTGRRLDYGDNLFVVTDRHGRQQALGPTHEEVITDLAGTYLNSYRDLPITLYQIQTKFRDEYRPRFGVLRSREFQMKDAYSFDLNAESLDRSYQAMYEAYCRIFDLCGLPYEIVEAESGPIGGSASHEFMVPSPTGEDVILKSDKGDYAANVQKCSIGHRGAEPDLGGAPTGNLEEIRTPDCASIDAVTAFFKREVGSRLKPQNMLKTLVYELEGDAADVWGRFVVAIVRGDHDVNETKLSEVLTGSKGAPGTVQMASGESADAGGFVIGFVGPHVVAGRRDVSAVVDVDAAQGGFWVTGANEIDHHVKHFNWTRDVLDAPHRNVEVADIRKAADSDPSPLNNGGVLRETRGIEIGHLFKLGTKYTEALGVDVLDEDNQRQPVIMGCYGIGANRILAATIERDGGNDEHGIIWPVRIAPYEVIITPIRFEGRVAEVAQHIADELESHGRDVLIDDRDQRPGVKFTDADLIGIPLRITIGEKSLKEDQVELKPRRRAQSESVNVAQAAARAVDLLKDL